MIFPIVFRFTDAKAQDLPNGGVKPLDSSMGYKPPLGHFH